MAFIQSETRRSSDRCGRRVVRVHDHVEIPTRYLVPLLLAAVCCQRRTWRVSLPSAQKVLLKCLYTKGYRSATEHWTRCRFSTGQLTKLLVISSL